MPSTKPILKILAGAAQGSSDLTEAQRKTARANAAVGFKEISTANTSVADFLSIIADETVTPYVRYVTAGTTTSLTYKGAKRVNDNNVHEFITIVGNDIYRQTATLAQANPQSITWSAVTISSMDGSIFESVDDKITYDGTNYHLDPQDVYDVLNRGKTPYITISGSYIRCFFTKENNGYLVFTSSICSDGPRYYWCVVDLHEYNGQHPYNLFSGHDLLQSHLNAGVGIAFNERNGVQYVDNDWTVNRLQSTNVQFIPGGSEGSTYINVTGIKNHACNLVNIAIPSQYTTICGSEIDFKLSDFITQHDDTKYGTNLEIIFTISHQSSSLDNQQMQVNVCYDYTRNNESFIDYLEAEIMDNPNDGNWSGHASKFMKGRVSGNADTYKITVRSGTYRIVKMEHTILI